jgi:hypothetical protein
MQAVVQTRNAVNENADGGNAAATAEAGMQLQGLFQELVPIYDRMNLGGGTASQLAKEAAAHANTVVMKAKANDLAAAKAAAGEINCGGCHGQFREKTDAGFQIKTGG